jgi:hypothetical protein
VIVLGLNLGYVHGTAGRVHRDTIPPQRELLMALVWSPVWSAAGPDLAPAARDMKITPEADVRF